MIEYGQPWETHKLAGRVVRVQYIDPVTAFDLEPVIVRALGGLGALALVDPARVLDAMVGDIKGATPSEISHVLCTRVDSLARGALALAGSFEWVRTMFERLLFGRVFIDGKPLHDWDDVDAASISPRFRWRLLGLMLSQTYRPLWSRESYDPGNHVKGVTGVTSPNLPIATQWAARLASDGYAGSMREILDTWTPSQLLDAVDTAAHAAAIARKSQDDIKGKAGNA